MKVNSRRLEFNSMFEKMYDRRTHCVKSVTFVVTEDCTLRCSYCYEKHKNKNNRMSFETGKKCIDRLFEEYEIDNGYMNSVNSEAIVLEFIGGEPLMEIDLIDKMVDYFKYKAITKKHPWAIKYMVSMTTNGTLYNDPRVQKFIQKNINNLSITITIDGNKTLHDSCRVFPDGSGSYDIVEKSVKSHLKIFPESNTKLTIAPENVSFLVDAVKNLKNLGMVGVNANCVYEEGWTVEHAKTLYEQLKKLADYMLSDTSDFYCSFFDFNIGSPNNKKDNNNWCGGTGLMLAFDTKGDIYPCLRYVPFTLVNQREPMIIGTVDNGIGKKDNEIKVVQLLNSITRESQSTTECMECNISTGCGWCSGYNYDVYGTPNKRATFICITHKARVLANTYYWNKYYASIGSKERIKLNIPDNWALEIISNEELDMLKSTCMVKKPDIDYSKFENPFKNPVEKKEIIDMLYDAYMLNVQSMIKTGRFKIEMRSIKDIPGKLISDWNTLSDKYLVDTSYDRKSLGRSILENGTYWPFITRIDDNGTETMIEGIHRFTSLMELITDGDIEDIEVPVLITPCREEGYGEFYLLNPLMMNEEFVKRYEENYSKILNNFEFEMVNEYLLKIKGRGAYIASMMIVIAIRNAMFDYSLSSGEFYEPRLELNNKEEMKKYFYGGETDAIQSSIND